MIVIIFFKNNYMRACIHYWCIKGLWIIAYMSTTVHSVFTRARTPTIHIHTVNQKIWKLNKNKEENHHKLKTKWKRDCVCVCVFRCVTYYWVRYDMDDVIWTVLSFLGCFCCCVSSIVHTTKDKSVLKR